MSTQHEIQNLFTYDSRLQTNKENPNAGTKDHYRTLNCAEHRVQASFEELVEDECVVLGE